MRNIVFFSSVPGLAETFPIKPAKEVIPKWAYVARADYVKNKNRKDNHIYQCPGIFEALSTGYIISAWHDFELETDGSNFRYTLPDQQVIDLLERDPITQQGWNSDVAKFIPKPSWSVKSILKLNTPWHVLAPRGVKFLMMPLPYPDDYDFQSCIGILDPGVSTELNIQGWFNNLSPGPHLIKAGTPLAQLIPITESTYEVIVRDKTLEDQKWLDKRKYLNFFGFSLYRQKVKDAYNRLVGG